jgi:small subunit ribosomal protein S6
MTRKYEGIIVLNTRGKEESIDDMIGDVGRTLESEGAKLEQIDRMGKKRLAYTPRKMDAGYYVNFFFEVEPSRLDVIRSRLKLHPDVFLQHFQVLAR